MKVIITGMHRSGTSLVAGLLKICGLYLGSNLITGLKDNPKGHFEDRAFVKMNDRLLKENGGSWKLPPDKVVFPNENFKKTMADYVHSWPKDRPVGWKDPRACLTLHLWHCVIKPENLKVIVVSRPFDEIAESLHKRNKIPIKRANQLSFIYMKRLVKLLDQEQISWEPTVFGNYFKNWRKEFVPILGFLGLGLGPASAIEDFIDSELWHNRGKNAH